MAVSYEEGASKHRQFLKKRQKASDDGRGYSATRSTKEITEGAEVKDLSQRRDLFDTPIKLIGLRDRVKKRRR